MTAKEAHTTTKQENLELLAEITKALEKATPEQPHWGHVGDQVFLKEQLMEIAKHIKA